MNKEEWITAFAAQLGVEPPTTDQIDQLLKVTQEQTRQLEAEASERRSKDGSLQERTSALDARVDKLVIAIGELVSRMPARG